MPKKLNNMTEYTIMFDQNEAELHASMYMQ